MGVIEKAHTKVVAHVTFFLPPEIPEKNYVKVMNNILDGHGVVMGWRIKENG